MGLNGLDGLDGPCLPVVELVSWLDLDVLSGKNSMEDRCDFRLIPSLEVVPHDMINTL